MTYNQYPQQSRWQHSIGHPNSISPSPPPNSAYTQQYTHTQQQPQQYYQSQPQQYYQSQPIQNNNIHLRAHAMNIMNMQGSAPNLLNPNVMNVVYQQQSVPNLHTMNKQQINRNNMYFSSKPLPPPPVISTSKTLKPLPPLSINSPKIQPLPPKPMSPTGYYIKPLPPPKSFNIDIFLKNWNLEKYLIPLKIQGVDDLLDFKDLELDEITQLAINANMKRLHQKQFIKAIQQLQSGKYKPIQSNNGRRGSVIQRVYDKNASDDDYIIEQLIEKYEDMRKHINQKAEILNQKHLPLHKFTVEDICNKLKYWVYNDINYKKHLLQTMEIFSKFMLSGHVVTILPINNTKSLVQNDMSVFISLNCINILFHSLENWKNQLNDEDIINAKIKSAPHIAYMIYAYPLIKLISQFNKQKINGQKFIQMLGSIGNEMENITGWNSDEIYQCFSLLLQHKTFTRDEFVNKIHNVFDNTSLPIAFIKKIQNTVLKFEVDELHLKIKTAQSIESFSDTIINMVDQLIQENEKNKINNQNNAYFADDFTKIIYESIAKCFIIENSDIVMDIISNTNTWICYNCGNKNFGSYIAGEMNTNIEICSLCGIKQIYSIILKLKNYDTYYSDVTDSKHNYEQKQYDNQYDLDHTIQSVITNQKLDLSCPYSNNQEPCQSVIRLLKQLKIYKKWLNTVSKVTNGKDDVNKTITVDIIKYITDDVYRNEFIHCAKSVNKITENDIWSIQQMFNDNRNNINYVKTFVGMNRKQFAKMMETCVKLKLSYGVRLYKLILKSLKSSAQYQQFGEYLSEFQIEMVNNDYYHILKCHIKQGNKITIENTFNFFALIHFDDSSYQISNCRSLTRKSQRSFNLNNTHKEENKDAFNDMDNMNDQQVKDMFSIKQYYIQGQLDMIHSYLCHNDKKTFVQLYQNQYVNYEQTVERQSKYVTETPMGKHSNDEYGFGFQMNHTHLSPICCSIHDEVLYNELHSLSDMVFDNLIIKSIKTHEIISTHKKNLICKYYDKEYNILRNEKIGIKHILVLCIYTDISPFCTVFRQTYRTINNETTEQQVVQRHLQLYHCARSLYEAVEFFGNHMEPTLKVYHGLNKVMFFQKFTTYFNQPISTTKSIKTAQQFSEGHGIILTLKSGIEYFNESKTKTPKYLNVSFLSDFPHEDEKLFYGCHIVFRIDNIIEAHNMKGHSNELYMLNKFQQTIQNYHVKWDINHDKDRHMINALVILMKMEISVNENVEYKEEKK
eukprot:99408_1